MGTILMPKISRQGLDEMAKILSDLFNRHARLISRMVRKKLARRHNSKANDLMNGRDRLIRRLRSTNKDKMP